MSLSRFEADELISYIETIQDMQEREYRWMVVKILELVDGSD